jgi:hypothetical protein
MKNGNKPNKRQYITAKTKTGTNLNAGNGTRIPTFSHDWRKNNKNIQDIKS